MLEAWTFIAATLLVVSGGAKIADPAPTRGALELARLPSAHPIVVSLGIAEILAGLSAVALGGLAAWPMAALYLGFAGFVGYALRADLPIQSCGCFGRVDTPPSRIHVTFNLAAASAASGIALGGATPWDQLSGHAFVSATYIAFVVLGTWISYLLLAQVPRLWATTG